MMSSEEDVTVDSFGLLKKTKRSRQRVDAGEPRNSYSSIPNFSSRPNLLNSGIYGAFFAAQNHHNFASTGAYFNQGFGPTKMLNELLSRRVKTITDNNDAMMTIDVAGNDVSTISGNAYECLNSQSPVSRVTSTLNGGGSPPVGEMAQHMLRNILQGRKKELYALEQELLASGNSVAGADLNVDCGSESNVALNNNNNSSNNLNTSNNNNNSSANNNNDVKIINLTNNVNGCGGDENGGDIRNSDGGVKKESLTNGDVDDMDIGEADDRNETNEVSPTGQSNNGDNLEKINNHDNESSSSERSVSSPESVSNKDDAEESNKECNSFQKNEQQAELKRARVENIVSSMRSSPLPVPVNGCKKRKLYHPQQHDNSVAERYDVADTLSEDEDENLSPAEIREKVVEKNALKNQLRTMQEQLAEMQQKYVQLCTRMDQDSVETMEQEETTSDVDQEDDSSIPSPAKNTTPAPTPVTKEQASFPTVSTPVTQPSMSPAISKMLASKFLPQNTNVPHMNPHSFPLHPNFNGALSFLQHQMFQEQQHAQNSMQPHHHPHHHHPAHPHPALSNAAAMYLGVSHKLLMEQEARIAKEAALVAEHQHMSQNAQHAQHQLNQQQNAQQMNQHQSLSNLGIGKAVEPSSPRSAQNENSPKSQNQQACQQPQQHQRNNNDFTDRLQLLKSTPNPAQNNFDLEGLADALKSEITSTLSNLIDTIVTRFLHQKRLASKTSEATLAAEQLNKDLLLASQLLDRKSPRTKVIDRGNCVSSEKTNSYGNTYSTPTKNSHSNSGQAQNYPNSNPENNINAMNLPTSRAGLNSNLFPPPKLSTGMNSAAAAALYSSMNSLSGSHMGPFCLPDMRPEGGAVPEQNEALSLVVAPKKKRHKVTDTRITPRTVSRILAQDGMACPPNNLLDSPSKYGNMMPPTNGSSESPPPPPPPRSFHVPPSAPMLPVSLPTSVAIPNPGLHESQVFSPYSPFYGQHQAPHHIPSSSPPGMNDHMRDSPPLPHHSSLFHPAALLAAAQQQQHHQRGNSPDYMNVRSNSGMGGADSLDRGSDCNSMDGGPYDGMTPTISFLYTILIIYLSICVVSEVDRYGSRLIALA